MKKILSVFTVFILTLCGCSDAKTSANSKAAVQVTASQTSGQTDEVYTIEDIRVLQDFLLGRRTTGNGRDFDLCKDGVWDAFDLCLLKREVMKNMTAGNTDILVTYFSCTGNTEQIAEYAASYLNADSYEIIPEIPYTEDDLKYYTDCRADREQNDPSARPAISGNAANMDEYEIVFIGYPIWHGQAPKIIYTFLESYDFSDKIIVPFCTSGSSPIGSSTKNLHSLTSDSATWLDGQRFSGNSSESDVTEWIDSLNLNIKEDDNTNQKQFYIIANNRTFTAEFAVNSSADAFRELLSSGDVTIKMSDYGNFEKVGSLGTTLPRNDENITTEPGDIILYQGNSVTVYYDENTWNFTRLGKINNVTKELLLETLGEDDVEITFSLSERNHSSVSSFDLESGKNQNAPTVTLNSGYKMPIAGIGTYSLNDDTCVNSIKSALEQGVRLIDTAYMYGNEAEVGQAIRESGIPREDIFVITKIYPGEQFENPEKAIQDSLNKLDIDYIDMMLLHHPGENDVNAYLAMEKFAEQGKIRSLGLSNWYIEEIDDFIAQVNIRPALVQNEIHPYYQERNVIEYMHNLGIIMQAWYPLGGRGHTGELLADETIIEIAEAHGKSAAQVILRWDLQNGVAVIPGSSNPEHILENISIFDFSLTDEEMEKIDALNRDEKHDWY